MDNNEQVNENTMWPGETGAGADPAAGPGAVFQAKALEVELPDMISEEIPDPVGPAGPQTVPDYPSSVPESQAYGGAYTPPAFQGADIGGNHWNAQPGPGTAAPARPAAQPNGRVCAKCGAPVAEDAVFCGICGNPMAKKVCSKCGKELADEQRFCPYCGKKVSATASVSKTGAEAGGSLNPKKLIPLVAALVLVVAIVATVAVKVIVPFVSGSAKQAGEGTRGTAEMTEAASGAETEEELAQKNEELQKAEALIQAIGDVTPESEDAIQKARAQYDALDPESQEKLQESYAVLTDAEEKLDKITGQIRAVEDGINGIGQVTEKSGSAIFAARNAYDKLNQNLASYVSNYDVLTAAEESYAEIKAKEVSGLIDGIGEVTLYSGDAIDAAERAYEALDETTKGKVSNAGELASARATYKVLQQAWVDSTAATLTAKMTTETDAIYGTTFYTHKTTPQYTDIRCYVMPYIGRNPNGSVYLCAEYDYTGEDWIFWKAITYSVDGVVYTKTFNYFDIVHEVERGAVWEYLNTADVSDKEIEIFRAIGNASEAIIRFQGDDYYYDLNVSSADKTAIREVLALYDLWSWKGD